MLPTRRIGVLSILRVVGHLGSDEALERGAELCRDARILGGEVALLRRIALDLGLAGEVGVEHHAPIASDPSPPFDERTLVEYRAKLDELDVVNQQLKDLRAAIDRGELSLVDAKTELDVLMEQAAKLLLVELSDQRPQD